MAWLLSLKFMHCLVLYACWVLFGVGCFYLCLYDLKKCPSLNFHVYIFYWICRMLGLLFMFFQYSALNSMFYVKSLFCCRSDPVSSWGSLKFHPLSFCISVGCLHCIFTLCIFGVSSSCSNSFFLMMLKSPSQNHHRMWSLPSTNSFCLYSSFSIPVSLPCLPSATSWRLSTRSSPQSSRTMLSRWNICAATLGPSRAWTTAMSSNQQSEMPGCLTWLTAAAGHMAQRLLKVGAHFFVSPQTPHIDAKSHHRWGNIQTKIVENDKYCCFS